ncbi:hypothetical protein, partial [Mesorhizobium sp.]|uniref:hypothetical protein n=1 Tax=Mesorhizobium sp. TaxID=1871066 RepID=UPI0025C601F2
QKTVGAGIAPSASLSDQEPVTAATSVKSSRQAGLDFDGPASRHPKAASVPDHADLHPCGLCRRTIEGFTRLHGSIGPPSAFARFPRHP